VISHRRGRQSAPYPRQEEERKQQCVKMARFLCFITMFAKSPQPLWCAMYWGLGFANPVPRTAAIQKASTVEAEPCLRKNHHRLLC
jgi:hypothetical protein